MYACIALTAARPCGSAFDLPQTTGEIYAATSSASQAHRNVRFATNSAPLHNDGSIETIASCFRRHRSDAFAALNKYRCNPAASDCRAVLPLDRYTHPTRAHAT